MKYLAMIAAAMLVSGSLYASVDDFTSAADSGEDYVLSLYENDDSDRSVSAPEIGSSEGESLIDQFTSGAD